MFEKLKTYNEITDYLEIARRYFINNFYDGMLTILGILLGFFVILLNNPNQPISSSFVVLTGLATSISMLVSGFSGSYLSERAELRKEEKELEKAMVLVEDDDPLIDEEYNQEDIQKAMVIPVNISDYGDMRKYHTESKKEKKKIKTLYDKAENFSVITVSIVNGVGPFLGGLVPILPFFFVKEAGIDSFLISFILIFICILLLGVFLGVISEESIPKSILQMLGAFTLTILVIILFLR
jgi:VIT1/CCC1 family predicted Fe2+/Mn2+ transporter